MELKVVSLTGCCAIWRHGSCILVRSWQTAANIKSLHILWQYFKIFKIFIQIWISHIFIPIFRVFKYLYKDFICKEIFTIVVWALTCMNMPGSYLMACGCYVMLCPHGLCMSFGCANTFGRYIPTPHIYHLPLVLLQL